MPSRALATIAALVVAFAPASARAAVTLVPQPQPAITILLFHQVSERPTVSTNGGEDTIKKPWVTPQRFDAILGEAERAGYGFVTMQQARAFFLNGTTAGLPAKPMLLTFDDGYRNAWTEATPILRKHHAQATMFFEGILTGTRPDRLNLGELRAMAGSGAWALASHGWMGHSNITIDAAGTKNPYWYANLMWLPDQHRLETYDEFQARITADLRHFREAFEPAVGPITMFAFPSGEFGQSAPLEPGGDPATRVVGHSNVAGLTPYVHRALRAAGYDLAFAVSVPGVTTPASRADDPDILPRLGVGEDFELADDVLKRATVGMRLPEIVHDRYADPGAIAPAGDGFYVASTTQPVVMRLDRSGRERARYELPALLDDRAGQPALISGLLAEGTTLYVLQEKGGAPHASAHLTTVALDGPQPRVVERRALATELDWLVGIARLGTRIVGLGDDGSVFDVQTGEALARIALPADAPRQDRFVGPVVIDGVPYAYDKIARRLVAIGRDGTPAPGPALAGDIRHLAASGNALYAVDATGDRHILYCFEVRS